MPVPTKTEAKTDALSLLEHTDDETKVIAAHALLTLAAADPGNLALTTGEQAAVDRVLDGSTIHYPGGNYRARALRALAVAAS